MPNHDNSANKRAQSPYLRLVVTALETRGPSGHLLRLEIEPTEIDLGSATHVAAPPPPPPGPEIEIGDADIIDVEFDLDVDPSAILSDASQPPQFFRRAA